MGGRAVATRGCPEVQPGPEARRSREGSTRARADAACGSTRCAPVDGGRQGWRTRGTPCRYMAPRAVDGGRRRSPEGRVDAPYNHIYPGELETQNPFHYSVRAAIRLLLTSGGRWLVESDESWSSTDWRPAVRSAAARPRAPARYNSSLSVFRTSGLDWIGLDHTFLPLPPNFAHLHPFRRQLWPNRSA
jgi:hypothetical protein